MPTKPECDYIVTLYKTVYNEISRYRDREWINVITFTTAMFSVLSLKVNVEDNFQRCFWAANLFLLAIAKIFFTCYAHKRLAINRFAREELEKKMGIRSLVHDIYKINRKSQNKTAIQYWNDGLKTHLIPFFIVDIVLLLAGIDKYKFPFIWGLLAIFIFAISAMYIINFYKPVINKLEK